MSLIGFDGPGYSCPGPMYAGYSCPATDMMKKGKNTLKTWSGAGIPLAIRFYVATLLLSIISIPAFAVQVGKTSDGTYIVPTKQLIRPAGKTLEVNGRPVDLMLSPDNKIVYVKDNKSLLVVDASSWKIIQQEKIPGESTNTLACGAGGIQQTYHQTSSPFFCPSRH